MAANSTISIIFRWRYYLLVVLAISIYLPTISYDFALDDAIVIYDNDFTKKGLRGIPDLFRYDTFRGFFKVEGKAQLVSGGRYRPLTPAMFAIEYTLSNGRPWLFHLMNVLFYGMLCLLIVKVLEQLFINHKQGTKVAWMAAILFAVHPVHVEVVANIKGRDEIISLLCSLIALKLVLDKRYWLAALAVFMGLLAKEMAVTIVPIAGLSLIWFRGQSWVDASKKCLPLILATLGYIIIRTLVIGVPDVSGGGLEMMNNPFVKLQDGQYLPFSFAEKSSTIFYSLLEYLRLLFWPHPLTHDYYPRHIGVINWGHWQAIASTVIYSALTFLALRGFQRKSMTAYGIGFYLISLILVSNILFPIGTHMGERFLFMASLGWAISLGSIIATKITTEHIQWTLIGLFTLSLAFMSLSRSPVWKNDKTLFTHDVRISNHSAKALNAAAGVIVDECIRQNPVTCPETDLKQAIDYLEKALEIHPNYKNAYLIKGNAHLLLKDFEASIEAYQYALSIDMSYAEARRNVLIAYTEAARYYGEERNDVEKALQLLNQLLALDPNNMEGLRLAGVAYGVKGEFEKAISYFNRILVQDPNNAEALRNIGISHLQLGNELMGQSFIQRSESLEQSQ